MGILSKSILLSSLLLSFSISLSAAENDYNQKTPTNQTSNQELNNFLKQDNELQNLIQNREKLSFEIRQRQSNYSPDLISIQKQMDSINSEKIKLTSNPDYSNIVKKIDSNNYDIKKIQGTIGNHKLSSLKYDKIKLEINNLENYYSKTKEDSSKNLASLNQQLENIKKLENKKFMKKIMIAKKMEIEKAIKSEIEKTNSKLNSISLSIENKKQELKPLESSINTANDLNQKLISLMNQQKELTNNQFYLQTNDKLKQLNYDNEKLQKLYEEIKRPLSEQNSVILEKLYKELNFLNQEINSRTDKLSSTYKYIESQKELKEKYNTKIDKKIEDVKVSPNTSNTKTIESNQQQTSIKMINGIPTIQLKR